VRLFHQLCQLRGAEAAPPVQRRRRIRLARVFVLCGNIESWIRKILRQHASARAGGEASDRKPARRTSRPGRGAWRPPHGDRRNILCHTHPPPGRSSRHRAAGVTDSRRGRREALDNSFTAVMLSAEPDAHPSRVRNCGTVPQLRDTRQSRTILDLRKYKMMLSCRHFLNFRAIPECVQAYQDFM